MAEFQAASDGGPVLEPGPYILELLRIEDAEGGQYGPQVRWSFAVTEPEAPDQPLLGSDGEPYVFYQWSSTTMKPGSKGRPWVEAIYGRPLANGERPRPDLMIGRRMKVLIVHVSDANGKTRARISSEVAPKPYPRCGEQSVEPIPQP